MSGSVTERYLLLGLRLGRHVDGIVDAYYGPPELAEAVASAEPVEPRLLVDDAEALLHEVPDGWLRDQIAGLRTYAGALAGDAAKYSDEVEGCYGVRPPFTDEEIFAAAHASLEQLLPGEGALADRHERWKQETRVPADRLEPTLAAVIEAARTWTREAVGLPEGEGVSLEIVHDEPWMAFCEYLGGLQSHISVNGDLPIAAVELLRLAIHETYPGHHAESCSKDQLLVRGRGVARGDDPPRPDTPVARLRGDRVARARAAARGRGRPGPRRDRPRRGGRLRPPPRSRRRARAGAVRVGRRQRRRPPARAPRDCHRRPGVPPALGPPEPRARRTRRPLPRGAQLPHLHPHVPRGPGALPRLRGGRPGTLPAPPHRAGARRRAPRGRRRPQLSAVVGAVREA